MAEGKENWNDGIMEDWNNGRIKFRVPCYKLQVKPLTTDDSLTIRKNVVQCCCS
jgi:hypothetical protein